MERLKGNRIYLDANIWIYALEDVAEYSVSLAALFKAAEESALTIVTSELTCRNLGQVYQGRRYPKADSLYWSHHSYE